MAYKKLIKVSNVCQLLDKSKFSSTNTVNGVTFTNNGDGSFTVNGTASARTVFYIQRSNITYKKQSIPKYLFIGAPICSNSTIFMELFGRYNGTNKWHGDIGNGIFFSDLTEVIDLYIVIQNGYTADNFVFKPQLFDLTEMYGAGKEPTTVEQFRQDFPDEMYDYSPYCWLTSYKRVFMTGGGNYLTSYQRNLTCKTKNLLPYPYRETTVTKSGVIFTDNGDGSLTINGEIQEDVTAVSFTFFTGKTFEVNEEYTLSYKLLSGDTNSKQSTAYMQMFYTPPNSSTQLFTTTVWLKNSDNFSVYNLSGYLNRCVIFIKQGVVFNNYRILPMLNLGDTATDYVPYGHL